jgi:LmbE family N-acetylglucosaminyl deacetylase
MSTLVVAPHPDDEVLGAGGLIARRRAQGRDVHVAVVTRPSANVVPESLIEQCRGELRQAHAVLGISSCTFLDFPAPMLDAVPLHEIADALSGLVAQVEPDEVLLPHAGDIHIDHRVVNLAGLVAVRPRGGSAVRRVLAYETLSETEWAPPNTGNAFVPTYFVDISEAIDLKLQALGHYVSQLRPFPDPRSLEAVEALARVRGSTVGVQAAEAFLTLRVME